MQLRNYLVKYLSESLSQVHILDVARSTAAPAQEPAQLVQGTMIYDPMKLLAVLAILNRGVTAEVKIVCDGTDGTPNNADCGDNGGAGCKCTLLECTSGGCLYMYGGCSQGMGATSPRRARTGATSPRRALTGASAARCGRGLALSKVQRPV